MYMLTRQLIEVKPGNFLLGPGTLYEYIYMIILTLLLRYLGVYVWASEPCI